MDFDKLFKPQSMAVVGVSSSNLAAPTNVIYKKNKNRYPVEVFAVNQRGGILQGDPLYTSISDLPKPVDLVVIGVPARFVPDIVEECIAKGCGGAVLIGGGFTEVGNRDLQDRIVALSREADFPIIGPNCLGLYAPGKVDTIFVPPERMMRPPEGGVAVISQSGAFMVDLLVKFAKLDIGVSAMASIGNKAVIREIDLLSYLDKDPQTWVIALYLEGFEKDEGRRFVTLAKQCRKPVMVIKSGKSAAGAKAVSSHTASMAGDYKVLSEILHQYGIIEVKSEYELLSYCKVLSVYPRKIEGNVGIISVSGGHGAIATDLCVERGMTVPRVPDAVQDIIRSKLTKSIQGIVTLANPMDLTASALEQDFVTVYDEMSKLSDFDAFLLLVLPYGATVEATIGAQMSNPAQKRVKPLVAYTPHVEKYRMMIEGFEANGVPVADSIEGAVMMLDGLRRNKTC